MKPTPSTDAWMDESHRATEWGATLKPQRSSSRVLIAVTLLAMALAAFFYLRVAQQVGSKPRPKEQPVNQPEAFSPPLPTQQRPTAEPAPSQRIQRVAKCLAPTGTVSYSDGPCPTGTRPGAIDLRPDSNLADGMSPRKRDESLRQNAAAAQAIAMHERRVALNVDQAGTECAQLDALIAAIDSAARLPQPGLVQDRLREQRKQARDKQFALRCR